MSEFIEISYNLVNAILYYKKKKDASKLLQVLIRISDKSAEDFAELTLQGYFEKIIKNSKKKFLGNFKPNSKKGVKLIGDIKEDLTSYFVTLNEIMNSNKIPLSNVEVKQAKLLDEMREILNMETSDFYSDYILKNIEIENRTSKKKTKETFDLLLYSSLLNEERITLGYFLLFEKLYGADSSNYYCGPFYYETYPPNYDEINNQHNNLIQALYPQKNTFKASDVIETLISKKILVKNEGRWSKSKKTFWQSTINYNFRDTSEKSIQKIANETAFLITNLIKKYSSNDDILIELLLLEEGVPEEVVEKAIGENFKELIKKGFKNCHKFKDTWRIKFNPNDNQFNMIEKHLTLNKLDLINIINQKKDGIVKSLSKLEKQFIAVMISSETIIEKHMGKNYSDQTIKKYKKKISEIELNYNKKISVLAEFTNKRSEEFSTIYMQLIKRGIIWKEHQGFSGFMDVHKIVLKSLVEIELESELKSLLI